MSNEGKVVDQGTVIPLAKFLAEHWDDCQTEVYLPHYSLAVKLQEVYRFAYVVIKSQCEEQKSKELEFADLAKEAKQADDKGLAAAYNLIAAEHARRRTIYDTLLARLWAINGNPYEDEESNR